MSSRSRASIFVVALLLVSVFLAAQTGSGTGQPTVALGRLRQAIALFAEERYSEALPIFDSLMLESETTNVRSEGLYWTAMTHIALGSYQPAQTVIETFLELYPDHARVPDLLYQQGRLSYLLQDYEKSLQILQVFISMFPDSSMFSSALFWVAENMYELGRLAEAEKIYRTIQEQYRDSVKAEAASYRIELIRFKHREEELLTLLKWSHEESLKTIEEFQRREKSYEQALSLYQRRYGDLQSASSGSSTAASSTVSLQAQITQLEKDLAAKNQELASLKASQQSVTGTDASSLEQKRQLLDLKERLLALLAFYAEKESGK